MPDVLVTGATGAVGRVLVDALVARGRSVRALARSAATFPGGVEVVLGDVTDAAAVEHAMRGVQSVFHLAARLHEVRGATDEALYEAVNVGGTANIVSAARSAGVKRLIFFSTIAVYGENRAEVLTEESTPEPVTIYGRTKLAAERIVQSQTPGLVSTILRVGAVYGPHMKGNYPRLVKAIRRRMFVPIGSGENVRSLIHERDLVRAAILAEERNTTSGAIYNVTDGELHAIRDINAAIAAALHRRPPRVSIPATPARHLFHLIDRATRILGVRSPVSASTVDKYLERVAVDSSKIQRELGFKPEVGLREGWVETVAAFQRA